MTTQPYAPQDREKHAASELFVLSMVPLRLNRVEYREGEIFYATTD
jgi:hypothetical protein